MIIAATLVQRTIRLLREEAHAANDTRTIDICDVALASRETANEDGTPLLGPDGEPMTRTEAREIIAAHLRDAEEAAL